MPSPTVSADDEDDNTDRIEAQYGFNELTSDQELKPLVIESLRMLGEAMGRREYFVSDMQCHCYLRCLYCGSTAYPPKEKHVQHNASCMLSIIYQNITKCVAPPLLKQAFNFIEEDFGNLNHLNNHNLTNIPSISNLNKINNLNSHNPNIPPIPIPPIPSLANLSNNNMNDNNMRSTDPLPADLLSIAPYSRRNSSGSFSLIRQDQCDSFNGLIGPYNSLTLIPGMSPSQSINKNINSLAATSTHPDNVSNADTQSIHSTNSNNTIQSSLNNTNHLQNNNKNLNINTKANNNCNKNGRRSRSGSFTFIPVSSSNNNNNNSTNNTNNNHNHNTLDSLLLPQSRNSSFGNMLSMGCMSPMPLFNNASFSGNLSTSGYGAFPDNSGLLKQFSFSNLESLNLLNQDIKSEDKKINHNNNK